MSLKSELQEIIDMVRTVAKVPNAPNSHNKNVDMVLGIAEQAILDLLDKSLQEAYELGFNDASRKYNSSHDARIEKIPPHLRDEFEAEVRKVIKEEL